MSKLKRKQGSEASITSHKILFRRESRKGVFLRSARIILVTFLDHLLVLSFQQ
ncbi:MAG TPA: hypothetical protein VEP90_26405 [Methylomirabilota bacterium]|nr:hypothetical protein [Methylomirabilota bacterium]